MNGLVFVLSIVFEAQKILCLEQRDVIPGIANGIPGIPPAPPVPAYAGFPEWGRPFNAHRFEPGPSPPPPPPHPPPPRYPVQHAGLPRGLMVYPVPFPETDHELQLNVTWLPPPPFMTRARDYSIEVRSLTNTTDCRSPMCYEYNIPGDALWWLVPSYHNPVAETCAVRPGCDYRVRLIAHPWDGHTAANMDVSLDECVAGVCSCGHAPRLPAPVVRAEVLSHQRDLFVNISWSLPPPRYPRRLPPGLQKQAYYVSIGKQMVSDAHPSPWFANTVSRRVNASGDVSYGESTRWILLPISERSGPRDPERSGASEKRSLVLDVKLLARVNLVDERGCVGPAGNATAYDPEDGLTLSKPHS